MRFLRRAAIVIGITFVAYLVADWSGAQQHFQEALRLVADDKASKLMLERCHRYSVAPPPHWDGVSH